jgi:hypothetical protein
MAFTQIINDFIDFANTAKKNNTTINRAIWERYLDSLSDDELIMLETFMYFGRDSEDSHNNDIVGYRKELDHDRDSAKVHIADKAVSGHLAKYLKAGLTKSASLNIDIDTLI